VTLPVKSEPVREPLRPLTDEEAAHVGLLLQHRPDVERLELVLCPAWCHLCRAIAKVYRVAEGER
jgi:hypothetical protein